MARDSRLLALPPELRRLIWNEVALTNSKAVNATIRTCRQVLHEFLPIVFKLKPGTYAGGDYKYSLVIAIEPTCVPGEWLRLYCVPKLGRRVMKKQTGWNDEATKRIAGNLWSQMWSRSHGRTKTWEEPLICLDVSDMDDPIIGALLNLPNLTNITVIFEHPQASPLRPQPDEAFLCQWAKAQDVLTFLKQLPRIDKFRLYLPRKRRCYATSSHDLKPYWQSRPRFGDCDETEFWTDSVATRLALPFMRLKAHAGTRIDGHGEGRCKYDIWDLKEGSRDQPVWPYSMKNDCSCEGICTTILLHRLGDMIERSKFSQPTRYEIDPQLDSLEFWEEQYGQVEARVKSMDRLIDRCPGPQANMLRLHRLRTRYTSGRNFFSVDSSRWKSLQKHSSMDSFMNTRTVSNKTLAILLNPRASFETQELRRRLPQLEKFFTASTKKIRSALYVNNTRKDGWNKNTWVRYYPQGISHIITKQVITVLPSSSPGGCDHLLIHFGRDDSDSESSDNDTSDTEADDEAHDSDRV